MPACPLVGAGQLPCTGVECTDTKKPAVGAAGVFLNQLLGVAGMSKINTASPVESIKKLREMQARAAALPPSSNTGGNSTELDDLHRAKIESSAPRPCVGEAAIVDTLTFSFSLAVYLNSSESEGDVAVCPEVLRCALGVDLFDQLDLELTQPQGRGKNFYRDHFLIRYAGSDYEGCHSAVVGFVAFGGNKGTACVHLSGKACEQISVLDSRLGSGEAGTWYHVQRFISEAAGRITRIDLAYDDIAGDCGGVDAAVDWYLTGGFTPRGRRPSCSMAGDWLFSHARTFYVGKRENGKMVRVYEKGHQLGADDSAWVRIEAEIHSVDRVIPLDAITRPTAYLAGAAPCLAFVLDVPPVSIKTIVKEKAKITLDHLKHWASVSYGGLLNVLSQLGLDPAQLVEELRSDSVPSRLDVPPALSSRLPLCVESALGTPF